MTFCGPPCAPYCNRQCRCCALHEQAPAWKTTQQQTSVLLQEQYWVKLYASRVMKPIKVTNGYSCDSVPKKRNRPIQLRDWLFRLYFVSPAGLVDEDSSVSVLCKCFTIQSMMGRVEFAWMTVKPHTMVAAAATPVLMLRGCSCDDFYSWT